MNNVEHIFITIFCCLLFIGLLIQCVREEILNRRNTVYLILRKNYPKTVKKMRVKDLDPSKLSKKFRENIISPNTYVYVKCDDMGNIEYRGKNKEYRTYNINHKLLHKIIKR